MHLLRQEWAFTYSSLTTTAAWLAITVPVSLQLLYACFSPVTDEEATTTRLRSVHVVGALIHAAEIVVLSERVVNSNFGAQ